MTNLQGRLIRRVATRGVVAALPVAMAAAYASGLFIQPPRLAARVDYVPVAEIVSAPTTVGIADSPLYWMSRADIDKQLDQMLSIGVTNVRVLIPWALVEPTDNQFDWSHIQDVMDAAAQRNMGVLADINATPIWAATSPGIGSILLPGSDIPKVDAFVDFMKVFVTKYANTVSAYEIWNEPNYIGFSNPINPEAYAALLQAVYPVIKDPVTGLDKTATVVAGALGAGQTTFGLTMSPVEYLQRMIAAGALNSFDALSFHPYNQEIPITGSCPTCPDWMLTPSQQLDAMKAMIDGKKIWITEYGLPTTPVDGGITAAQQSAWLKDMLDYWQSFGSQAGPMFLYNTKDAQAASTNPEDNFGLFYNNWDPKDAAAMLKAWIAAHLVPATPNPQAANPIAQFFAAIQQAFQSFGQVLSQLFNPFSFVQSIFQGIANLFGFGTPVPAAVVTTSTAVVPAAARMALSTADSVSPETSSDNATASQTPDASASVSESVPAVAVAPAVETAAQAAGAPAAQTSAAEPEVAQAESQSMQPTAAPSTTTIAAETVSAPKAASTTDVSDAAEVDSKTSAVATSGSTSAAKSESADASSTKPDTTSTAKAGSSTASSSSTTSSSTSSSSTSSSTTGSSTTGSSSTGSEGAKTKAGSDGGAGGGSSSSSSGGGGSSSGSSGGGGSSD